MKTRSKKKKLSFLLHQFGPNLINEYVKNKSKQKFKAVSEPIAQH